MSLPTPKKPVLFRALDSKNNVYEAVAETCFHPDIKFGSVFSNIPEQPKNMRELIDLRHKGYKILDNKEGVCKL